MSIEAMKQALEALRSAYSFIPMDTMDKHQSAESALRQAIEQAESFDKLVAENQRLGLYDDGQPTCQENRQVVKNATTWVGLTDEEIYDYADKFLYQHGSNYGIKSFGKAIEAKLKEKNT